MADGSKDFSKSCNKMRRRNINLAHTVLSVTVIEAFSILCRNKMDDKTRQIQKFNYISGYKLAWSWADRIAAEGPVRAFGKI